MTDQAARPASRVASRLDAVRDGAGVVRIPRLVEVKALDGYRLWAKFADGTEGEVDMATEPGRAPPRWHDPGFFETAHVRAEDGAVAWGDSGNDWDACPDSIWLTINGIEWTDLSHGQNILF